MTGYDALGVTPVINASATLTRLGGSRMPKPVMDAMAAGTEAFVDLVELQRRAGERIAALTGNEACYICSGAAAGIAIAVAACIAGTTPPQLPACPTSRGRPPRSSSTAPTATATITRPARPGPSWWRSAWPTRPSAGSWRRRSPRHGLRALLCGRPLRYRRPAADRRDRDRPRARRAGAGGRCRPDPADRGPLAVHPRAWRRHRDLQRRQGTARTAVERAGARQAARSSKRATRTAARTRASAGR